MVVAEVFGIALLVSANAFYVAAEFAAVAVRPSEVQTLANDGHERARRLAPILTDTRRLDDYIATCQVGITISSLVLGAFGQATITPDLSVLLVTAFGMAPVAALSTAALVVLVVLTVLQVVLGELVPKTLALQYPARVGLVTVVPMTWSSRAMKPLIVFLNGSGSAILRALRVPHVGHRHVHAPDELALILRESRRGGTLETDEYLRYREALRLSERPVAQLMVPRRRIIGISASASGDEVVRAVLEHPFTRYPVFDGSVDNVVGMIHLKDVARAHARDGTVPRARELARALPFVPESINADRLLTELREKHVQQAVVVDEYGSTSGVVTMEDVLGDLVGDVAGEFTPGDADGQRLPDGRVRLPGRMALRSAEQWTGVPWDGTSATVSGHVTEAVGRLPVPGDVVTIEGVRVEVESVTGRVVRTVVVTPLAPPGEEGSRRG